MAVTAGLLAAGPPLQGQEAPRFTDVTRQPSGEVVLAFTLTAGRHCRLEASDGLSSWQALVTLKSSGANSFTDGSASGAATRFYRVIDVAAAGVLTGDHVATAAGDVVVHPVDHASFVLGWNQVIIYNDPVGGSAPYLGLARPNLILVSHSHGDHFNSATLNTLKQESTWIIAPAAVYSSLSSAMKLQTIPLANGAATNVFGLTVEAIPAYNANHPKGAGNGYVLTVGERRFYMSGDTGNIPEMRALPDIDVAFLCMNVPFTMSVAEAVTATRAFRPRVVYPYHFRNSDGTLANLNSFKAQVGLDLGIEVRPRKWY